MIISWANDPAEVVRGRRVAVVGLGVVAPAGIGAEAFWEGLFREPSGGEPFRRVEGFDPSAFLGPKEARRLDRFAQMALAAAEEARADAGDLRVDPDQAGVVVGTGVGGLETLEAQVLLRAERGDRRVSPFLVPMMMANAAPAAISMRWGWRGPCETVVTACAAGSQSIAAAARLVATGRCVVALGGGAEASITPTALAGFGNMTALSSSGISRPFDKGRDGFVMGEGAGMVLLEEWEHAKARGARIYAELAGVASTADAYHITAPEPAGAGALSCMRLALQDAGIQPSEVGQINAHGTSTPAGDAAEAAAIVRLFGSPGPPVTSLKGVNGHALGAAGGIEAVGSVLSILHKLIPPTGGVTEPDRDLEIDLVFGKARPWEPGAVLSNSFGFGGHNSCLVFLPPSE